ncbi:MAG: hypothetical protein OXB84_04105 [Halobacteriovoraceae bacterium]|nr:hypothetical protein [Halobacteriovoraceae bacterium]
MKYKLFFNIYKVKVFFECNDRLLYERIKKDFHCFLRENFNDVDIKIESNLVENIPWNLIPKMGANRQSRNSITYDKGNKRYNDYYGKLLSIYDYKLNIGKLYAKDIEKLHEISYLLILSISGKKMDSMALHKLHAFGVIYNKKAILGMMPSKGGKTTHLLEFLKDPDCNFISDDTPVIGCLGKIYPFALRIGIEDPVKSFKVDKKYLYSIKREYFGTKKLISIEGVPTHISNSYNQVILFLGKRHHSNECHIVQVGKLTILSHLFTHMIIGVGLPTVIEYFWKSGFRDFLLKTKIFFSRCLAAFALAFRSKNYIIYLGNNIEQNINSIKELAMEKECIGKAFLKSA